MRRFLALSFVSMIGILPTAAYATTLVTGTAIETDQGSAIGQAYENAQQQCVDQGGQPSTIISSTAPPIGDNLYEGRVTIACD